MIPPRPIENLLTRSIFFFSILLSFQFTEPSGCATEFATLLEFIRPPKRQIAWDTLCSACFCAVARFARFMELAEEVSVTMAEQRIVFSSNGSMHLVELRS